MRTVLHIITRPDDELAGAVLQQQEHEKQITIRKFDLTQSAPDYNQLLDQMFEADSIQVW